MSKPEYLSRPGKADIDSLHCLKALCAFLVVMIHSSAWGRDEMMFLLKAAVPCFYAISGFFLYSGEVGRECAKAWRWGKKIVYLHVFLSLLYLGFHYLCNGSLFEYFGQVYSLKKLILLILTGFVPSVHLWYLASMWQALLLFVALRRLRCWGIAAVFLIMCADALFFSQGIAYCHLSFLEWQYCRPLWALALMGGGYTVARYQLYRIPAIVPLLLFAVCSACVYVYLPAGDIFCPGCRIMLALTLRLCYLLMAAGLLTLCVKYPRFSIPFVARIGKDHSADIYYYHVIVKWCVLYLSAAYAGICLDRWSPPFTFLFSLLLSVLIGRVTAFCKKRQTKMVKGGC